MGEATLPLFAWLTPAFPVGGFAYSHGLEWAVEAGDVRDEASLTDWLADVLDHGAGRSDSVLLARAHDAAAAGEAAALKAVNDLALALAPSAELNLETTQQGRSFLDAVLAAWPNAALIALAQDLDKVAYPVAVGLAAGCHGAPRRQAVEAFLMAFTQTMVSAVVRLGPVGQTGGARTVARLAPLLARLAADAEGAALESIGSAVFRADLGSLLHETQYTRLFRS